MTVVNDVSGELLVIQLGDGASPEAFAANCTVNMDRSIGFTSDGVEYVKPDCADPSAPAWKYINIDGKSMQVQGAGKLDLDSHEAWFTWFDSGDAKNCRINVLTGGSGDGSGYWAGAFKCTGFNVSGARKNPIEYEITIQSHGPVTWTAA